MHILFEFEYKKKKKKKNEIHDIPPIKIRANQLQSITQCNANTDLNFRLKFSKTTWPTETIYISFKSIYKHLLTNVKSEIIKHSIKKLPVSRGFPNCKGSLNLLRN